MSSEPLRLEEVRLRAPAGDRSWAIALPSARFVLLVLPFLALACWHLLDPELLGYHHYRQAHDAMTARGFATFTVNPMLPVIDGVSWGKSVYVNEFPLYPWIVGMLWRVTGESLIVARLVALAFGVAALGAFRRLMGRLVGAGTLSDLATLLLGMMPVSAWFLRTVQRQSLFLFVLLLGIERTIAWIDEGRDSRLWAGSALLSLAVLLNPFAIYAGLPIADRMLSRHGVRALFRRELISAGLVALVPALLWYGRVVLLAPTLDTAAMVAVTSPVTHRDFLDPARYAVWLAPAAWSNVFWTMARFVLPVASSVAVFALGLVLTRRDAQWRFLRVWLAAVVAYFVIDVYPIAMMVHQYYYLNIAPPAAAFTAAAFLHLFRRARSATRWRPARLATAGLAAFLFAGGSLAYTGKMVRNGWHAEYYPIAAAVETTIPPGRRVEILADSDDPLLSWILGRSVQHRLTAYTPAALERILRDRDYDYLAVVHTGSEFPQYQVLDAIRVAGIGPEVLNSFHVQVFRAGGRAETSQR